MNPRFIVFFLALAVLPPGRAEASAPDPARQYAPEKPEQTVALLRLQWRDPKRSRTVPVKIYYPAKASAPCPLIIFSHGLGGNRDGYGYVGQHWAGCGYISAHLQHPGSDSGIWQGMGLNALKMLKEAVADPVNAVNRVEDVHFAIDQMLALNRDPHSPLHGLVDAKAIGMAGHSFGAWTTLAVVGERTPGGTFTDSRIKAAIAMSAPVPAQGLAAEAQFGGIAVPVFHMTGTLDDSPIGETVAAQRRIPFDHSHAPGTCLLILNGADHMTFAGHLLPAWREVDAKFQAPILAGSTAFWDATLRGDAAARHWLYDGGFAAVVGKSGTFEKR